MNSASQIPARECSNPVVTLPEPGAIGWWSGTAVPVPLEQGQTALRTLGRPIYIVKHSNRFLITQQGTALLAQTRPAGETFPLAAYGAALDPAGLGDISFQTDHAINYAYMSGSMANGIASTRLVKAMAGAGLLASFGAAGLPLTRVLAAVEELQRDLGDRPCALCREMTKLHEEVVRGSIS